MEDYQDWICEVSYLKNVINVLGDEYGETQKLIKAFWTGQHSEDANMDEVIMAQWGRKRIEAMSSKD